MSLQIGGSENKSTQSGDKTGWHGHCMYIWVRGAIVHPGWLAGVAPGHLQFIKNPGGIGVIKMAKAITTQKGINGLTVTVTGYPAMYLEYSALGADIRHQAMVHGLTQKLGDAAAKTRDGVTGKSAPLDVKYNAIKAVFDNIIAGNWNLASGGVPAHALTPERVTVLAGMFAKTEADIMVWAKSRTDAQLATAFTSPKFALALAEHRAKTRTTDEDAFSGLDEEIDA